MVQQEYISGRCPRCGEHLEIPAHLEQFSCLYCGARLTREEFTRQKSDSDASACAEFYRTHVLEAITAYPGIDRCVTPKDFTPAFKRYSQGCGETFRQLDQAVSTGILTAEDAALYFLDVLEAHWAKNTAGGRVKPTIVNTDKFVIAIFLVPMVRRMQLPVSEEYCAQLQKHWCARHPKSPFYLADYETIAQGFRKKNFGFCFITTAVCLQEGKADDCAELTAFRRFRDGYLRSCEDGEALIREYYETAPAIVLRLEYCSDLGACCHAIRRDYLDPCYTDLQAGRLAQCKARYVQMVRTLQQEFLN